MTKETALKLASFAVGVAGCVVAHIFLKDSPYALLVATAAGGLMGLPVPFLSEKKP